MRRKFGGNTASLRDVGAVEGLYEGAREVQREDGSTSRVHTFKPKVGDPVEIWGFGQIDFVLPKLQGKYVWLTYKGLQKRNTKFGLREVHTADIEYDDGIATESVPTASKSRKRR